MGRRNNIRGVAKLASLFSIAYLHGLTVAASLHIRPQTCHNLGGQIGTCMFVWDCIKTEGKHLGTCVDGFLFGSCCAHNESSNIVGGSISDRYTTTSVDSSSYQALSSSPTPLNTVRQPARPTSSSTKRPSVTLFTRQSTTREPTSTRTFERTSTLPTRVSGVSTFKPVTWSYTFNRQPVTSKTTLKRTTTTVLPQSTLSATDRPFSFSRPTWEPYVSVNHHAQPTNNSKPTEHISPVTTERTRSTTQTSVQHASSSHSSTIKPPATTQRSTTHFSLFDFLNRNYTVLFPSTTKKTTSAQSTFTSIPISSFLSTVTPSPGTSSRYPNRPTWKPIIVTANRPFSEMSTQATLTTAKPKNKNSRSCGLQNPHPQQKVVGGKNSAFGSWPWQASVRRTSFFGFSSTHRCGGALISRNWIATAGHCVDDLLLSQIKIRVGEYDFASVQEPHGYVERGVKKKVVHPKYNFFTYENDLALVQLEEAIDEKKYPHIGPICLPPSEEDLVGRNATVTGWGRLSEGGVLPSVLQEVQVPIISNEKCKNMFLAAGRHEYIPDIFMCAGFEEGGRDSCQGDSGGPLQIQGDDGHWFLAGIISWGIGCAEPNMPGVCTRISKFKEWVLQNIT